MTYAFDTFLASFKGTEAQRRMETTVEASPWHREANTWVHTQMVMSEYRNRFAPFRTDVQNNIALFALLFHDVGKPAAEETVTRDDGTAYRRYAGHEQHSAVAFMEEYVRNPLLRAALPLGHARAVRWIIEHHLPYGLKDVTKRRALRTAMLATLTGIEDTFYDCLRSDCAGRISDDHETKKQNVEDWIATFRQVEPFSIEPTRDQKVYVLVGPSASGKSTWTSNNLKAGDEVISMDSYRLEYARHVGQPQLETESTHTFYDRAWQLACVTDEKNFNAYAARRVHEQFNAAAKSGGNVIIDIVNASKKRRAPYVDMARRYGFKIVGVEFWTTTETLIARQKTRPDKAVPEKSVRQQQYATTCMWLGYECEDVMMLVSEHD